MIKEFIATGATVDIANANAKAGLNAPLEADVKFEILEMPKKKLFGILGTTEAKVRVYYEYEEEKIEIKEKAKKPNKKKPNENKKQPKKETKPQAKVERQEPKKEEKSQKDASTKITDEEVKVAKDYLTNIMASMKVEDFKIEPSVIGDKISLSVECEDAGILIGRRGDTLDAIQYLTTLAVKNSSKKYIKVSVDVGDYRAKRDETVIAMAKRQAIYCAKNKRRYTFEPMNPYERRLNHTTDQEIDGVHSKSIGLDDNRRVVIEADDYVRQNNYRKPNNKKTSAPKTNTAPKADRADLPKFGKIEV